MAQTSLNSTGVASTGALSLQSNGTTEAIGISTGQVATLAQNPILTSGVANGLAYLNGSKVLTTGSALVFDGTNLGLGVTPSAWGNGGNFQLSGANIVGTGGITVGSNMYYNAGFKYIGTGSAARYDQVAGQYHAWFTAPSGTAGNPISFTQAMTLDASGNLTVPAIYTNTTAAVSYVAVSSTGLLQRGGVSALKYKQDVRDLENIDVDKFRAVRYKSKCENDDQTKDYFGVIADEVEAAGIKELVTYAETGEVEGFQYERLSVVLLKEIQALRKRLVAAGI